MLPIKTQLIKPPLFRPEKPAVLLVVTDLQIGGTPLQVYRLAMGLKSLGCRVYITSLAPYGPIADLIGDTDIEVFPLDARSVRDVHVVFKLARLIARLRVDVCHSFLVHANVVTRLAALLARCRPVVSTICTAERQHRWHLKLENLTFRLGDATVCISRAVQDHMHSHAFIPTDAMTVVNPGIDISQISAAKAVPRHELAATPQSPILCFVGRLDGVKRIDLILNSLAAIGDTCNASLVIVGDGPERETLEQLTADLKLTDRVRFLGFRNDVPAILKSCDAFVLASDTEGWSIATAEALAVGLPVVATDVAGPSEQIDVGKTGFIVPTGDDKALADGILSALKLGRHAVDANTDNISYHREARQYLQLYCNLIEGDRH